MLRELGTYERAVLVSNRPSPFHITIVARLKNPPDPETIRNAIQSLQNKHPLLSARIDQHNNRYVFIDTGDHHFPFQVLQRSSETHWVEIAQLEMAKEFRLPEESLFRVVYLYDSPEAELIISVHHAIADAVSTSKLIEELLSIAAGGVTDLSPLPVIPNLDRLLPQDFQGPFKVFKLARFALMQVIQEIQFQLKNRGRRKPPMKFGGNGRILTLNLPEEFVNALAYAGRRHGLTLNSILNTAQLIAVNRLLYQGFPTAMYTFTFADLRPFTNPPTRPDDLGSFVSMMRFLIEVEGSSDLWILAKKLQDKIHTSFKSGDKFATYLSSEMMLKMITKLKIMRFGASALNFNGRLSLNTQFGSITLLALHGFISGYDFGPEMGSQARIFNGDLLWDFIYLDTDLTPDQAGQIVDEIVSILKNALLPN